LFIEIFVPNEKTRPIAVKEEIVRLIRIDLGYEEEIFKPRSNEYQYIRKTN
jgi:hypothetical protein